MKTFPSINYYFTSPINPIRAIKAAMPDMLLVVLRHMVLGVKKVPSANNRQGLGEIYGFTAGIFDVEAADIKRWQTFRQNTTAAVCSVLSLETIKKSCQVIF